MIMTAILFDSGAYNGCPEVLLESSKGHYYLWNLLSDDVARISTPKMLHEIVPKLNRPDRKEMKFEDLEDVEYHINVLPAKANY